MMNFFSNIFGYVLNLIYEIVKNYGLAIILFSILLKLTCAIIEPISNSKITNFCSNMTKCISYLTVALISVSFMFFITTLLMMFSASAFL